MSNIVILKELDKLIEQTKYELDNNIDSSKNVHRLKQFKFLRNTISKLKDNLKSGDELKGIKGIGEGSINRINEILKKGSLSEVKVNKDSKYMKYIEELEQVYGIGRKTAIDFVKNKNIKTVKQLLKMYNDNIIDLPYHIQLGLKYYNIYKTKIPRKEINIIDKYFKSIIPKIDNNIELIICGSYRRKKDFSNDIDVLLLHKDVKTKTDINKKKNYLKLLVSYLHTDKFLLDDIDKDFNVKYMGFCKYKKFDIRRIDIMYIPYNDKGSALLHFTGSGEFNKRIRETALIQGFTLSQYGLVNKETGKKLKTLTEKDIFDKLGLEFIEPEDRD